MKRRIAIIVSLICCLGLAACENKEEHNSSVYEQEPIVTEEKPVEDEPAVSGEKESVNESVEESAEEVIGDVDVVSGEITMADMEELEVGVDFIPGERTEGTAVAFNGFRILFPGTDFITSVEPGYMEAKYDSIYFILAAFTVEEDDPSSIVVREDRGETFETIGTYAVRKSPHRNSTYGLQYSYDIFDTETDSALYLTVTINKRSEYQEYGDKLVEEFVPKFEEVLYGNLQ